MISWINEKREALKRIRALRSLLALAKAASNASTPQDAERVAHLYSTALEALASVNVSSADIDRLKTHIDALLKALRGSQRPAAVLRYRLAAVATIQAIDKTISKRPVDAIEGRATR
ncbi:MAG: hypothetical protein KatS3mg038_1005 [Candidatus Kapaibacterium sp.]|nr:MAG: hypothetical protein KatS3mg038_1005 [Candidatus Kapabacteria bacterium]